MTFGKPTIYDENIKTTAVDGCGCNSTTGTIQALQAEISRLQFSLEAEIKNRCCGNCRYMDTIFDITGERQCGITKFSVDRESDPCERWQSCRG
jgi:hypothetical protein